MMKWFLYGIVLSILIASCTQATAHEMVPTYPKLRQSHLDNVYVTTMKMFNRRADVDYYEVGVFDKDFNPIPFVTGYRVIKLEYLGHVTFDVYIRKADVSRVEYICSLSKLQKDNSVKTAVASKICSKVK